MAGEIDFLGIHFLGPQRFRARETTVNRLLRKIRTAIVAGRGKRPARQRYFRACRRINELFGYELPGRPVRCRIGKVRYVQPRQHAVLGHSELILEQMRRVDRTVRKWLSREFGPALERLKTSRPRGFTPGVWRVRSAARFSTAATSASHCSNVLLCSSPSYTSLRVAAAPVASRCLSAISRAAFDDAALHAASWVTRAA